MPSRAPGAKFKPKLPGLFWVKAKNPWAKQLKTKSTTHGWSSSEGKPRSVLSEAKTRGLFVASHKSMYCSEQAILTEVPRRPLGAKAPRTFFRGPVKSAPRAKRYGAKSAKKVRAKEYVTFLFGADLHEANIARAEQYGANPALVRFGLSRQRVRDFS